MAGLRIPRSILWIAAGLVALVVVAVVVVLLGSRAGATYPADTPEGTFQRYLQAYEDDDLETAHSYFSTRVQQRVPLDRYRRTARDFGMYGPRLVLERTDMRGDRATLHLQAREGGGGPFGGGYEYEISVRLVREPAGWRLDEPMAGIQSLDSYMFEELDY